MQFAMRQWLDRLPITDPVRRKHAGLLQLMLLGLLIMHATLVSVALLIPGVLPADERATWLIITPLMLGSYIAGIALLRRGRFQYAVLIPALAIICITGAWVIGLGLAAGAFYLLVFFIPITLAGLLAGRRVMIAIIVISQLWALLAALFTDIGGFIQASNAPILIAMVYCGVSSVLGICFNTFGFSLEDALKQALTRQRELKEMHDTLEQRVIDRTTEATNAQLVAEEANQMKSRFLANMSHELRTPLNAILNFTHFVQHPADIDDEADRALYLERVSVNATHLLGLINDILDLSKIEAGKIDLVRTLNPLEPVLKGVYATALGLATEKPVTVGLELDEPLPRLLIDQKRLRQVVLNLLSNAVKFTQQGRITLSAQVIDPTTLSISVQDTGIGIAPADQARIFEEFQQAHGDGAREYQGTGLGLAISRRLVELHDGTLTVTSTPGHGSTFTVTLPIPAASSDDSWLAAGAVSPPISDGVPRILVIDDDPDAHRVFRRILEPAGYRIYEVHDGRQALAAVAQILPAAIILDIQFPDVDGWSILAQLRSTPPYDQIPVVLCSVVDIPHSQLQSLSNVKDYLLKPVNPQVVVAAIQRWLPVTGSVAVIEDDADARAALMTILQRAGIPAQAAATGPEGLALIYRETPALVLLDLMLPGMDGFAILEQMAQQPRLADIAVIVITAQDLTADQRLWLAERTIACLHKTTLSADDLSALVHHILQPPANDPTAIPAAGS